MVKDKTILAAFTAAATLNAFITLFSANPIPTGIMAGTFALLAIAWAPRA